MRSRTQPLVALALVAAACTPSTGTAPPGTDTARTVPTSAAGTVQGSSIAPSIPATVVAAADGGPAQCWSSPPGEGTDSLAWTDITADSGLIAPLTGMHGHAAAWGDLQGDGRIDLLVGTFADRRPEVYAQRGATGPSPDRVLLQTPSGFRVQSDFPEVYGRTSGAAFVDLDLDGDLDLVVSRNGAEAPSAVYENDAGALTLRTDLGLGGDFGGRSVGVLHLDGDSLLDLIIVEDRYREGRSRLFRNLGDFEFEELGPDRGWPSDVDGLGVSTGDLNFDGWADIFVSGSNRLYIGTGDGVREVDARVTRWEPVGNEDDVAGSAMGDVDGDGRLDLVIGQHFNSTLGRGGPQPVRLFLNRTEAAGGDPVFEEVTAAAGLTPLPTKAPHVEFADVDNDGLVDIVTSASAGEGTVPAVFRNLGIENGIPRFATPAGVGSAQYWVTAPTADVDRDGRLDVLAVEWEPSLPTILFGNRSAAGNWLEVAFPAAAGGGPGTTVTVYSAGAAGDAAARLGFGQIVASQGYAAGAVDAVHVGLGGVETVDLVVQPPGDGAQIILTAVAANQRLTLPDGCG